MLLLYSQLKNMIFLKLGVGFKQWGELASLNVGDFDLGDFC